MGLVCNNVLHDRSGFTETPDKRRLLYRARYYERVIPWSPEARRQMGRAAADLAVFAHGISEYDDSVLTACAPFRSDGSRRILQRGQPCR